MHTDSDALARKQYLTFVLGGDEYAVGILQVKEILQYDTITPVPGTPPSIRGVINLRGSVVPVVDLAIKFGLPATAVTRTTCILILEVMLDGAPLIMGVMADSVREVIDLGAGDIEKPPSFGTHVRVDYLFGMGKVGKGFVLLLDIDRAITAGEKEAAIALDEPLPEDASAESPAEGAELAATAEEAPANADGAPADAAPEAAPAGVTEATTEPMPAAAAAAPPLATPPVPLPGP